MTLYEGLQEIYSKYGFFNEELNSITFKGIDGIYQIQRIMDHFINSKISKVANIDVKEVLDYKLGINGLPKSDDLKFNDKLRKIVNEIIRMY